ncbi:MAG: TonB-dependent receptor, partial [Sphingobacteriia bacterium]
MGYLGYETVYLRSLLVTSGKDLILNVEMTEALLKTEAIEIKGAGKEGTLNTMSTVSARTLNMEEANRYAGSFGDPARMAGNLAGVGSGGDTRNDIIVRGNSPTALVWRLEGVDIPNPNHFSSQGANGGPISILNNNLLANSDFFTGAFPAEYSNANAAAFDLRLRNGNTAKRESMFQLGFNGFELMTEGPLGSNQNSSYIASYRYSTLAAFDAIGIQWPGVSGIPRFQDFSFKLNFNKTPIGRLTFFGVGGISGIESLESDLDKEDYLDTDNEVQGGDFRGDQRMGVVGAQNTLFLDSKS